MCAIVGIHFNKDISDHDKIKVIKELISESSIRGRHATGIAWFDNEVHSESYPMDGKSFNDTFNFDKIKSSKSVIIHCRYSTSDINYNQPIYSNNSATVHNGVITQESPENWKKIGSEYITKNDTEILHNWIVESLTNGKINFPYPKASVACIHLSKDGNLLYFRNGKRPIYRTYTGYGLIITSTKDIVKRCNIDGSSEMLDNLKLYNVMQKDLSNFIDLSSFDQEDLQKGE